MILQTLECPYQTIISGKVTKKMRFTKSLAMMNLNSNLAGFWGADFAGSPFGIRVGQCALCFVILLRH